MKFWLKTTGVVLAVTAVAVLYFRSPTQRYARIDAGMTPTEVASVMGRPADKSSLSHQSHFEEWDVGRTGSDIWLWVEYGDNGGVIGKGLDEIRNLPSGESSVELARQSFLGTSEPEPVETGQ